MYFDDAITELSLRYSPYEFTLYQYYDMQLVSTVIKARLLFPNTLCEATLHIPDEFILLEPDYWIRQFIIHQIAQRFDAEYAKANSSVTAVAKFAQGGKVNHGGVHIWGMDGPVTKKQEYADSGRELLSELPSLRKEVKYPCVCKAFNPHAVVTLWSMIIHLNDKCKWSREDIADWTESLDIDLTFKEKVND